MTKRMLIDATHPEETRVAVVDGTRLEEFDFEIAARRQIKSNIYLAKVTRVEPSLQAAFVEYGGNRHGFLPFPEIHPDYYRIPVGDRPIYAEVAEERARRHDTRNRAIDVEDTAHRDVAQDSASPASDPEPELESDDIDPAVEDFGAAVNEITDVTAPEAATTDLETAGPETAIGIESTGSELPAPLTGENESAPTEPEGNGSDDVSSPTTMAAEADRGPRVSEPLATDEPEAEDQIEIDSTIDEDFARDDVAAAGVETDTTERDGEFVARDGTSERVNADAGHDDSGVDVVGGDDVEDAQRRRRAQLPRYKIQEVIKRRQIMLVQVSKEERGNKGAAVTTFLSLPGRYCVLMPNTARGGGVSRKIANPADRKRMKELIADLEVPEGMSVILRTAGVERSKAEIKRDLEYLLRLWENIRTLTLQSTAPALIYEEGNLVKRAIRDLYTRDIDSIEIAGEEGYRQAKDFMRMLMPSHAKRVQPYRDPSIPLFFRYQVESQIDLIHNPVVHLKSGGYIVINQTEALVSIDVNSGRSTRERNIEETALKTNCEAADEIARQLRLRDMGGLIVIDFIDMDEPRHDAQVERRLKEAMKNDRARIQVGRISPFGLLELSRQRLHPSLIETNFHTCAHCLGTGLVRSTESASLLVLRAIEEEGIKRRSAELAVTVAPEIALYILNQKRSMLIDIEQRYGFSVRINADSSLIVPEHRIERLRLKPAGSDLPPPIAMSELAPPDVRSDEEFEADLEAEESGEETATADGTQRGSDDGERKRKRRRRGRRRGREGSPNQQNLELGDGRTDDEGGDDSEIDESAEPAAPSVAETPEAGEPVIEIAADESAAEPQSAEAGDTGADETGRRRRRGRRGGRSRPRGDDVATGAEAEPADEVAVLVTEQVESPFAAEPLMASQRPESAVESETTSVADSPAASVPPQAEVPMPAPEPQVESSPAAVEAAPEPASASLDAAAAEAEPAADSAQPTSTESASETPPAQPAARAYEVVNQPPPEPKRGFWKRLTR